MTNTQTDKHNTTHANVQCCCHVSSAKANDKRWERERGDGKRERDTHHTHIGKLQHPFTVESRVGQPLYHTVDLLNSDETEVKERVVSGTEVELYSQQSSQLCHPWKTKTIQLIWIGHYCRHLGPIWSLDWLIRVRRLFSSLDWCMQQLDALMRKEEPTPIALTAIMWFLSARRMCDIAWVCGGQCHHIYYWYHLAFPFSNPKEHDLNIF